jgi:WD40 repeat protein
VAAVPLPDGRTLLASGGDDGTVRLWDPTTGHQVGRPLTGHTDWVRAVAAVPLPGGRTLLASGGDDGTVRLWDPTTGHQVGRPLTGHTSWVRAVAAVPLPGGRTLLASGGLDGTVRLWDPDTGEQIGRPLTGHTGWVHAVAAVPLPGGRTLLASGGFDGEVRLWDPDAHLSNRIPWWRSVKREQVQPISKRQMSGTIQDMQATDARCLIGAEKALIVWDTLADDVITIEMGPDVEAVTVHLPYTIVVGTQSGMVVLDIPTTAAAPLVCLNV